jgi:ribose transport system permease protein
VAPSSASDPAAGTVRGALPHLVFSQVAIYAGVLLLLAVGGAVQPALLSVPFLLNLTRQAAPLGIVATGQTIVMIGRSFDLSVGGIIGLVNVLLASRILNVIPASAALGVALLAGGIIGLVNGCGIVWRGIPPFIMTLGISILLTGVSLLLSGGAPGGTIPGAVEWLGTGRIGGVPVASLLWLAAAAAAAWTMRRTVFGRYVYATGGNPSAAALMGVPTGVVLVIAHVLSGISAALAGVLLSGYIGTGALDLGTDYMLNSLVAAVLGGTTFEGGRGTIGGTAAGSFFFVLLLGLLTMVGIGQPGKLMVQGTVVAAAVGLHALRRRGP